MTDKLKLVHKEVELCHRVGLSATEEMSLEEFKSKLGHFAEELNEEELYMVFELVDYDSSGSISIRELITSLMSLAPRLPPDLEDPHFEPLC